MDSPGKDWGWDDIYVVIMPGGNPATSNPSPSQDYPTPDDGRRANWSKRSVQSYTPDEDESPNNKNTFRSNTSSQSFRKSTTNIISHMWIETGTT